MTRRGPSRPADDDYADGRGDRDLRPGSSIALIEAEGLGAAFAEAGAALDWSDCRRNLLVEGLRLPREPGAHVAIGDHLVIEITDECEPCERMDALHPGLRAALAPDWRGGFLGRVVEDGEIAVGDAVRVL